MPAHRRSSVSNGINRRGQWSWRSHVLAGLFAAVAIIAGAPVPARAQQVLAVVNGTPITSYDVEQRSKLTQLSTRKNPSRKEVLEELINERLKIYEAKKYTIDVSNAEVDTAFGNMAGHMGMKTAQLAQALSSHGISPATLRARIRAELTWGQLVRGRFQSSLVIGDRDIQSIIDQKKEGSKDQVAYIFTLRPILLIVPEGSPPAAFEARRREADALRTRFDSCDQGIALARRLHDVAVREQIFRNSADLAPAFRTVLTGLPVGKLSTPETTAQGIEVFAVCDKKETRATTPQKEEVKQDIFNKRYEAQSKRYLDEIRRSAMIEYKKGVN